jgi:hypothetical protein
MELITNKEEIIATNIKNKKDWKEIDQKLIDILEKIKIKKDKKKS